jgi:hypothetical protein
MRRQGIAADDLGQRRVAELEQTITDLRQHIVAAQENARLAGQAALLEDENLRMSYQQAGDWVRMSNTVMWSLGSIYIVAAIIALNGAVQSTVATWRTAVGMIVALLALTWLVADIAYSSSTRAARKYLRDVEARWPARDPLPRGFYTGQHPLRSLSYLVTALLYLSAIVLGVLALAIAFPQLREFLGRLWRSFGLP